MNTLHNSSKKGNFIQLANHTFLEILKKEVVESAPVKQWKNGKALQTFLPKDD